MTEQKTMDEIGAMSREQLTARVTWLMPGMTLEGLLALMKAAEVIAVEHARPLDERSLAEEQRAREGAPVDAVMLNLDPQITTSPMAVELYEALERAACASRYTAPGEVVDVDHPGDRGPRSFGPRDEEPVGWQETQAEVRTRQEVR